MKDLLKHMTKKQLGCVGLAGLLFLAGLLLGEGQAKTVTTPPTITSTASQEIPQSRKHTTTSVQSRLPQPSKLQNKTKKNLIREELGLKSSAEKKKAGLAILFLGVLAEKS